MAEDPAQPRAPASSGPTGPASSRPTGPTSPGPTGPASSGPTGPASSGPPDLAALRRSLRFPAWLFPLAMVAVLEPPALIVAWAVDHDLANGHLLAAALGGGLFLTIPSLAIVALALVWDRRLAAGRGVPGLPPALTGPRASRVSAIALAASTVLIGLVLAFLTGAWSLLALPPLLLSLGAAWLMGRSRR